MCNRLFFFFLWYYLLLTSQETNPGSQSSCPRAAQGGDTAGQPRGALILGQPSSSAGPWAGPGAGTALPPLVWVRAAPLGQRGTTGTRKLSGKVSALFANCETRIKGIFYITVYDIFLNIERDFSCYWKPFISAFQTVFVLPFPSVSLLFFSCLCLYFLQCGTNTKHSPGRKYIVKFCHSSARLKAVQKPSSCLLHIWGWCW